MRILVLFLSLFCSWIQIKAADKARHVILIVWDGLRPDFVTEQNTPTLFRLASQGVTFAQHHSVYLSATEVNATAISTGVYPEHSGIIANNEFRPEIDAYKSIHVETIEAVRKGDELSENRYLASPTLAEIVRSVGKRAVVAGAKPV